MARDEERQTRAGETPIVGGLPDFPGIIAAMRLSPALATHLRGLADQLLVVEYPGATITRSERELLATAVSASNDCFYCMDSHGAFASALLRRADAPKSEAEIGAVVDAVKTARFDSFDPKMRALFEIALAVKGDARTLTRADVERALAAGATDADTQLAVLIASAFCMYNRMVDGLRAKTPPTADAFRARAEEIAQHGYSDARVQSVPK
jgi:uncharacterized peroxidase-related enzyme